MFCVHYILYAWLGNRAMTFFLLALHFSSWNLVVRVDPVNQWITKTILYTSNHCISSSHNPIRFVPTDASSFCSTAVRDSYVRSMTTSFGSICFGSLLVAIVEALESIVKNQREQSDGLLLCLAQCLLACLRDAIEYFNTW